MNIKTLRAKYSDLQSQLEQEYGRRDNVKKINDLKAKILNVNGQMSKIYKKDKDSPHFVTISQLVDNEISIFENTTTYDIKDISINNKPHSIQITIAAYCNIQESQTIKLQRLQKYMSMRDYELISIHHHQHKDQRKITKTILIWNDSGRTCR